MSLRASVSLLDSSFSGFQEAPPRNECVESFKLQAPGSSTQGWEEHKKRTQLYFQMHPLSPLIPLLGLGPAGKRLL